MQSVSVMMSLVAPGVRHDCFYGVQEECDEI